MSLSASGGFHIESLLSLRPPGALPPRPDPPELHPTNRSGCPASPSPRREPLPRPESPLRPRCASSFLIRDILADSRPSSHPGLVRSEPGQEKAEPGQVKAELGVLPSCQVPVRSDPGPPELDPGAQEDFQDESLSSLCPDFRIRGPNSPARPKKVRKARTAFSDQQLSRLERSFQNQKYLSVQDRMELAQNLQLSDTQVKTWYQNRRTKWKRQAAVGLELLAEAGRMFLPVHFLYPPAPPTLDLYLYQGHAHRPHQTTSPSPNPYP